MYSDAFMKVMFSTVTLPHWTGRPNFEFSWKNRGIEKTPDPQYS